MLKKREYGLIVIGGSNGGFEAVIKIIAGLPATFSIPVIIVLHRPKHDKGSLAALIQHYTPLKVCEPEDKEEIKKFHVYIASANLHLMVEKEKHFSYCSSGLVNYSRPSIDVLFETAALAYHEQLVGVMLSGANADGANGMKMINQLKGLTIVQDPATAKSFYMPLMASKICNPDYLLPVSGISKKLIEFAN